MHDMKGHEKEWFVVVDMININSILLNNFNLKQIITIGICSKIIVSEGQIKENTNVSWLCLTKTRIS